MRNIAAMILFSAFASFASAELFEAWDFKAIDGDTTKNIALFEGARVIQEEMGAHVEYWQHDVNGDNVVAYVIRFKDMEAWATFKDTASTNAKWLAWIASDWPKLQPHLVTSYAMDNLLDPAAKTDLTEGLNVSYMSAWTPSESSNNMALMESIQKSVAISDDFGINSNVYVNGPSGIFYIFNMDENYTALSKKLTARNASKAWQDYWSAAQINRVGEFVRQAWITRVAQ